jgi:hypothetical protein
MKKNKTDNPKKELEGLGNMKMTRKEAFKQSGYIALSAATMMMLLGNPAKAQEGSPAPLDPWGGGNG